MCNKPEHSTLRYISSKRHLVCLWNTFSATFSQDMQAGISDLLHVRRITFQRYFMHWTIKKNLPNYFKNSNSALPLAQPDMDTPSYDTCILLFCIAKPRCSIRSGTWLWVYFVNLKMHCIILFKCLRITSYQRSILKNVIKIVDDFFFLMPSKYCELLQKKIKICTRTCTFKQHFKGYKCNSIY